MSFIAIADYGMGNRRSVEKALEHVGARPWITADHDEIRAADGVILPGVGAFPEAVRNLARTGLDEVLRERAGAGAPLLGICLGLQRIVGVDGLVLEAALDQPHRLPVEDVDGRVEDQAATFAHRRAKLASSASPSAEDFSGWNCTPYTLPRATIETKGSPYSPRPTTSAGSAGRQANECTW